MATILAERLASCSLGLFRHRKLRRFISEAINQANGAAFLYQQHSDGTADLLQIATVDDVKWPLPASAMVLRVILAPFPLTLTFADVRDENDHAVDLTLETTWKIAEPRLFLRERGIDLLLADDRLQTDTLVRMINAQLQHRICDVLRQYAYADLQERKALPSKWWQGELQQCSAVPGLQLLEVQAVRVVSAEAEKAAEQEQQQRLLELEQQQQKQAREQQLELLRQEQEWEERKRRLELQISLNAREREHQLKLARLEYEQELLARQEEMERQRLQHQLEKEKLQAEIRRIRQQEQQEEIQQTKKRMREQEELLQQMEVARQQLQQAMQVVQHAATQGWQHAPRLAAAVISPQTVSLLHHATPQERLVALARRRQASSPDVVRLQQEHLGTRDIGAGQTREVLSMGDRLQFAIHSQVAGHATIINIGTSGKAWLLAPNALTAPDQCRIEAGLVADFPGAPLLPGMPLFENGPPGWEELVLIVSRQPLIAEPLLQDCNASQPFAELDTAALQCLIEVLNEWVEEDWHAATLGFVVA